MTLQTGTLRPAPYIHFGYGVRRQLPAAIHTLGLRVFVVADPAVAGTALFREFVDESESSGLTLSVYREIEAELPVDSIARAADAARAFAPDVVVGYGGGSAIDAAKLVALLAMYDGRLSAYYGENAVPGPILPVVAVPTTAGTGSEVTPVAVVSDPGQEMKTGISSPHLVPRVAIVDPELTLGAPQSVTRHAGIDALVHAIEAYTAAPLPIAWHRTLPVFTGRNMLADLLALEAIERIASSLPIAVADPSDRVARADVAYGSLLAGMAFGPTGTHLSHALQYPIGAATKTPHGLGTGLMLPYVMQACLPIIPSRLAAIGRALGSSETEERALAADAIEIVFRIGRDIGLPGSLRDIGVTRSQLPRIAALAMRAERLIAIAPIDVDEAALLAILESALAGDPRAGADPFPTDQARPKDAP